MTITYKQGCDAVDWGQLGALYREVGLVAGYGKKGDGKVPVSDGSFGMISAARQQVMNGKPTH